MSAIKCYRFYIIMLSYRRTYTRERQALLSSKNLEKISKVQEICTLFLGQPRQNSIFSISRATNILSPAFTVKFSLHLISFNVCQWFTIHCFCRVCLNTVQLMPEKLTITTLKIGSILSFYTILKRKDFARILSNAHLNCILSSLKYQKSIQSCCVNSYYMQQRFIIPCLYKQADYLCTSALGAFFRYIQSKQSQGFMQLCLKSYQCRSAQHWLLNSC